VADLSRFGMREHQEAPKPKCERISNKKSPSIESFGDV